MNPSERRMPIVDVTWDAMRRSWLVSLPMGVALHARDEAAVNDLIHKHAPGSSPRYSRPAGAPFTAAEAGRA